jgi:hypothetical protein
MFRRLYSEAKLQNARGAEEQRRQEEGNADESEWILE